MQQITLRELLKDPEYRKWFSQPPAITVSHHTPPWRFFAQREEGGRWAKAELDTYRDAYSAVRLRLPEYFDMAIHCKPQGFKPPIVVIDGKKSWMPLPDGHYWCVYCRRPTVFSYFSSHPAMPKVTIADYELRCSICAARLAGMRVFKPKFSWEHYRAAS